MYKTKYQHNKSIEYMTMIIRMLEGSLYVPYTLIIFMIETIYNLLILGAITSFL